MPVSPRPMLALPFGDPLEELRHEKAALLECAQAAKSVVQRYTSGLPIDVPACTFIDKLAEYLSCDLDKRLKFQEAIPTLPMLVDQREPGFYVPPPRYTPEDLVKATISRDQLARAMELLESAANKVTGDYDEVKQAGVLLCHNFMDPMMDLAEKRIAEIQAYLEQNEDQSHGESTSPDV